MFSLQNHYKLDTEHDEWVLRFEFHNFSTLRNARWDLTQEKEHEELRKWFKNNCQSSYRAFPTDYRSLTIFLYDEADYLLSVLKWA